MRLERIAQQEGKSSGDAQFAPLLFADEMRAVLASIYSTTYGRSLTFFPSWIVLHVNRPNLIERTIQYIKDRTEYFDDYFPCRKSKCKLQHIQK